MKDYRQIITVEAGERCGKICVRGMRITVEDILSWLAGGMSVEDILVEYDELNRDDVLAALSYAADRESRIYHIVSIRCLDFFSYYTFMLE